MFIDIKDFPFTETLESNWKVILDEFVSLPEEALMPFPEVELYGKGWSVFGLYTFGQKLERNCHFFPTTTHLVEEIPELKTASFSRLTPRTHIQPHVGYHDSVLRCHLGLITPDDCGLRVGNETRSWQEGKCFVFDDTLEHEAWNRSNSDRVVLLIDFTKPGTHYSPPEFIASRMPEIVKASQRYRPRA